MESRKSTVRRRYSTEQRAQVLAQCDVPGASVAKVAMAHGINVSVVHGWRQLARDASGARGGAASSHQQTRPSPNSQTQFVPVSLSPAAPQALADPVAQHIKASVQRGDVAVSVVWPLSASLEFAAWSRELLR
jgi:transposase